MKKCGAAGSGHRPGRRAGALVVLLGGVLALYVERGGRTILPYVDDEGALAAAAKAMHAGALGSCPSSAPTAHRFTSRHWAGPSPPRGSGRRRVACGYPGNSEGRSNSMAGIARMRTIVLDCPDRKVPQQFHVDLTVDDVDAAEQAVLALGATKTAEQPGVPDGNWRVYLDPAGHPFCLCWD